MAIGTPYNVGTAQNKNSLTITITTVTAVAEGDLILLGLAIDGGTALGNVTISDSAGNNYIYMAEVSNGVDLTSALFSCRNASALSAGSTITITNTFSSSLMAASCTGVSGITPETPVVECTGDLGSGTNPTVSPASGLVNGSRYLVVNYLVTLGPEGDTFTQDTANGWASPPNRIGTTGGSATTNNTIAGAYKIFNNSDTFTWAPTITSRSYAYVTITYIEPVENTLYYVESGVSSLVSGINKTVWAATSGGAGGAGTPTGLSTLIFDANSVGGVGGQVAFISPAANEAVKCKNITVANNISVLNFVLVSQRTLEIFGNATITSTNISFSTSSSGALQFVGGVSQTLETSATNTAGASLTVSNNTNLTISSSASLRNIVMEYGTLTASGNITAYKVTISSVVTGVPKTINMGSGTWTINANDQASPWDLSVDSANVTLNACPTLIISPSTPPGFGISFQGGGKTYKNLVISGLALNGDFLISGSNNFNTISSTITTAWQLRFGAIPATTNTFKSWQITGTPGNVVTLRSNADGSQATLSKPGPWNVGINSTDISGNTGLNFTGTTINYLSIRDINGVSTPAQTGAFFLF